MPPSWKRTCLTKMEWLVAQREDVVRERPLAVASRLGPDRSFF